MQRLLRDMSIGLKVSLAPAFAIACLVVVAGLGWWANHALTADLQAVGGQGVTRIVHADAYARQLTQIHQAVYQSLAWEAVGQRPDTIKAFDDALLQQLKAFQATLQRSADDSELDAAARSRMAELAKGYATYAKTAADTVDMKSTGVANAATFVVTLDQIYQRVLLQIEQFVKAEVDGTTASVDQASAVAARQSKIIVAVAALALGLAAVLALVLTRAITGPLADAARLAGRLAQGDLSAQPATASGDATGRVLTALGEVAGNLNGIVLDVRRTAEQINTASGEIASGNTDLSARTESTASALQQAAASIEQLSATLRQSADNAREANTLAHDASSVAREGGVIVADVVSMMDAINTQAKKIGEIIGTIDGIAFQTNILALNAAVEAARAGEQGRGFSVVASEVRTLAQRSSEAAREIRTLIGSSVEQIDAGVHKVQSAGQTMHRIVGAIERVTTTVEDISRATAEQASGISQVNQSVAEMDRSTQQNAAMVEQASAATESLRQQAAHLVDTLTRFRTA
jgi:methyl-accepting chemotaxis protein